MRWAAAVLLLTMFSWLGVAPASARPGDPVLIDSVRWDTTGSSSAASGSRGSLVRTLRVYPTALGRTYDGPDGADIAWSQVVALAPDADTPGMRMQFDCHWYYARGVDPDKASWNLEPGRPLVDETMMTLTRCNPGGPEV